MKTLAFTLLLAILGCAPVDGFQAELKEKHGASYLALTEAVAHHQSEQIRFFATGDSDKPILLFIHGTPGSKDAFIDYLLDEQLQQQFHVIAIDRPGWGAASDRTKPNSLEYQASILDEWVNSLRQPSQPLIVVGHSLGASLAYVWATTHGDSVDGLVMLSGALDAERAKPRWYNRMVNNSLARWLLPHDLNKSNHEIYLLAQSLSAANKVDIKTKAIALLQGDEDFLVYPAHADFAKANWPNAHIKRLKDGGHFTPWQNKEEVLGLIQKVVDQLKLARDTNSVETGG